MNWAMYYDNNSGYDSVFFRVDIKRFDETKQQYFELSDYAKIQPYQK